MKEADRPPERCSLAARARADAAAALVRLRARQQCRERACARADHRRRLRICIAVGDGGRLISLDGVCFVSRRICLARISGCRKSLRRAVARRLLRKVCSQPRSRHCLFLELCVQFKPKLAWARCARRVSPDKAHGTKHSIKRGSMKERD